jgi:hypothetical protein
MTVKRRRRAVQRGVRNSYPQSHSQFEHSSQMQTIEIYTPIREGGNYIGLNHETILFSTAFGAFTTPPKSAALIAVPMPNMMICNSGTISALN